MLDGGCVHTEGLHQACTHSGYSAGLAAWLMGATNLSRLKSLGYDGCRRTRPTPLSGNHTLFLDARTPLFIFWKRGNLTQEESSLSVNDVN